MQTHGPPYKNYTFDENVLRTSQRNVIRTTHTQVDVEVNDIFMKKARQFGNAPM